MPVDRPVARLVVFPGSDESWVERALISVYGVRDISTLYDFAYGLNQVAPQSPDAVWALAGPATLLSVVPLGFGATPLVEKWLGEEKPIQEREEALYERV